MGPDRCPNDHPSGDAAASDLRDEFGSQISGRAKRARNLIYAFGHGHQRLIGGSVTGKLVAELAAELPTTVDLSPFRADRF